MSLRSRSIHDCVEPLTLQRGNVGLNVLQCHIEIAHRQVALVEAAPNPLGLLVSSFFCNRLTSRA